MAKVQEDGQRVDVKLKSRYEKIEFDKLQMYFGEPYVIDFEDTEGSITIYQPSLGDIIAIGEKTFYTTLNVFITNTTSYKVLLWDNGIDWNDLSDFELFCMLYKSINPEVSKIMFHDLDFSKFELYKNEEKDCITLYNSEDHIEITEKVYQYMHQYLQTAFNMFPEESFMKDNMLKEMYIRKDRNAARFAEMNKEKGGIDDNSIQPLISSCVNHPGFKYKLKEMKEVGIYEFYDSVKRLQTYESATACLKGLYSGFVDGSKISADNYNFMKAI